MKLWSTFVSLLQTLLYGWVISLWKFFRLVCRLCRKSKKDNGHRPPAPTPCVPIDYPAFVRPDPLIYSQRFLLDRGLAVTWNNPDISLLEGGVPVSSSDLHPGTTYEVRARIWNNSVEAPVVNMPVHLSYLDFGIGTEPIPIASNTVDVGVKGSSGAPGFVSIPWTTPITPGHYCLQILLDPYDDTDRSNNLGQENTNVVEAHSPAIFNFTLRNNTQREHTYRFEIDAYELPARQPCIEREANQNLLLDRHRRGRHPLPPGFGVQIAPANPTLGPGASMAITVTIEPPPGFLGRQAVNVNAFDGKFLAGGVTLITKKEV